MSISDASSRPGAVPMVATPPSASGSTTPRLTANGQTIKVRHNMEMAHRLHLRPGKCESIHGHSWWVELEIGGEVDLTGMILEFGSVKRVFRQYLDMEYDHRLLLHEGDNWSNYELPGLQRMPDDPTTENVARWIGLWAVEMFGPDFDYFVTVWETSVNCATWRRTRDA